MRERTAEGVGAVVAAPRLEDRRPSKARHGTAGDQPLVRVHSRRTAIQRPHVLEVPGVRGEEGERGGEGAHVTAVIAGRCLSRPAMK